MTLFNSAQIDQALEKYREQLATFQRLRGEVGGIEATVTAPRQVVKVTVGAQGQLTELTFPTGAYRQLTPTELSSAVMTTIEAARAEVNRKTAELMAPTMPSGISAESVLTGKVDFRSLIQDE